MTRKLLLVALLLSASTAGAQGHGKSIHNADAADVKAVTDASFGYIDALYKVDTSLVLRYVSPNLAKRGYFRNNQGAWQEAPMSYQQLVSLSGRWNKEGKQAGPGAIRDVAVLEVLNRTAVTRIQAVWGVDYLALAKYDDGWKIVNILWQEPPNKK